MRKCDICKKPKEQYSISGMPRWKWLKQKKETRKEWNCEVIVCSECKDNKKGIEQYRQRRRSEFNKD